MKKTKTTAAKPKKATAAKKAAAPKKVVKKAPSLKEFVQDSLDSDKAKDIVCIDLKGRSSIADAMFIATGTSSRHVAGIAQKLRDRLKTEHGIKARVEGADNGDWVIVDAGDIIIHVFRDEVRDFYNLEKLWGADFSTVMYTRYQPK